MRIRRMVGLAVVVVATTGTTLPSATLRGAPAAAPEVIVDTWPGVPPATALMSWEQLFALQPR